MHPKITLTDLSIHLNITRQGLLKRLKKQDIAHNISSNKGFLTHLQVKNLLNLKFSSQIIAIQIVKGGSGKTAITMGLGVKASLYGAKVLLVDMDQQANLSEYCEVDLEKAICMYDILKNKIPIKDAIVNITEGIDILPSKIDNAALDDFILFNNFSLDRVYRDLLSPLKNEYDLILIDCPPALGRSVGAINLASNYVLTPVTPDKQCLKGLSILDEQLETLSKMPYGHLVPYKIVYNKYDGRTSLSRKVLTALLEHEVYKTKILNTYIRQGQEFANVYEKNISLYDSIKSSSAQEDIDCLTRELLNIKQIQDHEAIKL